MKPVYLLILSIVFSTNLIAQKIHFIRGCNGGPDNNLNWRLIPGPCILLGTINLYGKDSKGVLPFSSIDSNIITGSKNYVHLKANFPSNKAWYYFFKYSTVCGIDTIIYYTDTLTIDTVKPEPSNLDSVSVDPITNVVYLGWTSNKTPDFNAYYIYNFNRSNPILTQSYRDTFYIDGAINPKTSSFSYQITSSDSCDNARPYDPLPHSTIYLSATIDTCKNDVSLQWTHYKGWNQIKIYTIFRGTNSSGFILIDSVPGNINSYLDKAIVKKTSFQYFVRAIKLDTIKAISSSSNSADVTSGNSEKTNTLIDYVSNNTNQQIEIQISNSVNQSNGIDLYRNAYNQTSKIFTFNGERVFQDLTASDLNINHYFLIDKNLCGQSVDTSNISRNIVVQINNNKNSLEVYWNKYFTWNNGVKNYTIFRALGTNLNDANDFIALKNITNDTLYIDSLFTDKVPCYYIKAYENGGPNESKSNIVCFVQSSKIYYPNAIVVTGVNQNFNFYGLGIDLSKSSIKIYNRWDYLIFDKFDITNGWNGTNLQNDYTDAGVYFFTASIKQGENTILINGNITILK